MCHIYLLTILTIIVPCLFQVQAIEVETTYGWIKGRKDTSNRGKYYYAFEEIPYAVPPVGECRFLPPKEPARWNGTLLTQKITKVCMQDFKDKSLVNIAPIVTEDCLYLNVYTPVIPKRYSHGLPVLFWIFGDQFQEGAPIGNGPQILMDSKIILVTFNYRVGPFGFLSTNDEVIPGNLGLKDQHLALKWVVNNIKNFGGDPTKITIGGANAGAASVSHHVLSPLNKGLFRAAIIQSDSALNPALLQPNPRKYAFEMGRMLDKHFESENSNELLTVLQKASSSEIMQASAKIGSNVQNDAFTILDMRCWMPIVERAEIKGALITKPMHEALMHGDFCRVPILIGFNSAEYVSSEGNARDVAELEKLADRYPQLLVDYRFNVLPDNVPKMAEEIKKVYCRSGFLNEPGQLSKLLTDMTMKTPILRQTTLYSQHTSVYLYKYSHKSLYSFSNFMGIIGTDGGDSNTEELHYLFFDPILSSLSQLSDEDRLTGDRLLKLWTNFITKCNPTPVSDSLLQNVKWPRLEPHKEVCYLNINTTLSIDNDLSSYPAVKDVYLKYLKPPYWIF